MPSGASELQNHGPNASMLARLSYRVLLEEPQLGALLLGLNLYRLLDLVGR